MPGSTHVAEGRPTAAEVARRVADALDAHELRYAIGGALALAYYAPPRATVDVDVNIFVSPWKDLDSALAVLRTVGFEPDEPHEAVVRRATGEGQFRGVVDGLRVDVFVPAIELYAELESRRREVTLLGKPLWILGPEDTCVLKMMFFRRKDLADVEAVLRDQGEALDRVFVRSKLVGLVGEDDPRVKTWDEIVHDVFG